MDKITFTRSELFTLVWKFPLIQIAKHYEISFKRIRKKEWRDGRILLENNLALIVAKLELMAAED